MPLALDPHHRKYCDQSPRQWTTMGKMMDTTVIMRLETHLKLRSFILLEYLVLKILAIIRIRAEMLVDLEEVNL